MELPHPLRTPRSPVSRLRALLVALAVIPLALACTNVTSLDSASASSLRVNIFFTGALAPGENATVSVQVMDAHGDYVAFTGGQQFAIDGETIPEHDTGQHTPPTRTLMFGREAPGGSSYTFVYTDEHGRQTPVAIPGPRENFAILDPASGSAIHIPMPRGTGGQPVAAPGPYQPRPAELADAPLTVRYGLPYLPASLPPTLADGQPSRYAVDLRATGPCASQWPQCSEITSYPDTTAPTGTATIDDSSTIWGAGFETLAPGPGAIVASVRAGWDIPATGFLGCHVEFQDTVSEPITWE
jgi:hypothetical protein